MALAVLLVTGPLNALAHGVSWTILWRTEWGHVLRAKVALVLAMLIVSAVHGAYDGRRLERFAGAVHGDATLVGRRQRLQRQSVRFSAINLGLNSAIVGLAAWLAILP